MRLHSASSAAHWALTASVLLLAIAHAAPTQPSPTSAGVFNEQTALPGYSAECTEENIIVHKEWSALTTEERIDFTDSVQCLMNKPSRTPNEEAPAAVSRYWDFTTVHINNTLLIHSSGLFLPWHRHFLHLFQKALKEECGFKGSLPYWNWAWWADDLAASPIFDGSETSVGGNGAWNASEPALANGNFTFPRGTGGGCLTEGPFANTTIPFRHFTQEEFFLLEEMPDDAFVHRPHCLSRDLNNALSGPNLNQAWIDKMFAAPTMKDFLAVIDGIIPNSLTLAPHGGGHSAVGHDMIDQFTSPSDPVFWLHHSMIDNVWAYWQAQDPENRQFALSGNNRTLNRPPSVPVTVDYETKFDYVDGPHKLGELMDTRAGMYCYRYEYDPKAPKPC